jgi:isopenicillin-N epimerase
MNLTIPNALHDDFLLDPQIIYFNHGSYGATPRPVFESYQRWQRELESQPTEFLGRRAGGLLEQSRQALATYLGTSSSNLAYVTNATTGLNVAARSLELKAGDEVLATNHEYGALDRTWRFLENKQGFKYINHPVNLPVTTPEDFIDRFWEGVTPRTRVIFVSHITSPTALIFPVQEICRRARAQGILTIIDGAHAPGQIPLCLDALGADFYSGNLHKWLCAPKGAAFLYARSEVMPMIEPLVVSWGYQSDRPSPSPLVDYIEMQGTRDISAFLAVPDAIRYQEQNHWTEVRAACHALLKQTVQEIAALSGKTPISPLSTDWFIQMASAPIADTIQVYDLHRRLYEEFRIEIPILEWNGHKLIRCSFQAYNRADDARALVEGLRSILRTESNVQ